MELVLIIAAGVGIYQGVSVMKEVRQGKRKGVKPSKSLLHWLLGS